MVIMAVCNASAQKSIVGHSSAYEFDGTLYFISHAYTKASDARAKLFIRPLSFRKGWIE